MPIYLSKLHSKLLSRLVVLESAFERQGANVTSYRMADKFARQEGLVSNLWQSWCRFCRDATIQSTLGAVSTSGTATTSNFSHHTEREIAFVAKKLSQNQNVGTIRPIAGDHMEPTWGDVQKLNPIVVGLNPSNLNNMISGLSSISSLKDLQLCRNASAHVSQDKILEVRNARVRYSSSRFSHPSDMIFWNEPNSQDELWRVWLDEMRFVASVYIS